MRFFTSTALALAALATSVLGQSYAINGIPGGVQPRLEIRQMQLDTDVWNLFIAGLERLQWTDQNNPLSWYQISGIHGQPTIPWDNVQATGDGNSGYCPHSSNIFATWHRPYIVLLEQMVYEKAMEMVNDLPEGNRKNTLRTAAARMRFPYWDWAMVPANGGNILPDAVTSRTISLTYPNGNRATIDNPLYQYTFHPTPQNDLSPPFNNWGRTVRNPANNEDPSSPSNNAEAERNFRGAQSSIRSNVYNILTQFQSFNQFSNHGSESSRIGNLESIHDGIHTSFGGGHMLYLTVSAFDPIFWLHHTNVDRLAAMYQRIFPQTFITPFRQSGSTFFYNAGDTLDANSQLRPFHSNSGGNFWTSASAANIENFRYTYPELQNGASADVVRQAVNRLYAPTQTSTSRRRRNRVKRQLTVTNSTLTNSTMDGNSTIHDEQRTWIANIEAPWTALDGSYAVRLFYGNVSSEPGKSMQDPNYVGTLAILSRAGMKSEQIIRGSVVLTDKVQEELTSGNVDDVTMATVVENVKSKIQIRVEQGNKEIPAGQVPNLKVRVYTSRVEHRQSESDFPKWVDGLQELLVVEMANC